MRMCKLQKRLYTQTIWGQYNNIGIKISKLRLSLITIFPFQSRGLNLEFINIINYNFQANDGNNVSDFAFGFKLIQYINANGIIYINYITDIDLPVMCLPRLDYYGTITVDGLQKVLISRFANHSGINFKYNNDDDNNTIISLPTACKGDLYIAIGKSTVKIIHNECSEDLLWVLLTMGLKYFHILSIIANVKKIAYYKGKWYNLVYNKPRIRNHKYGFRKLLRHAKNLFNIYENRKCTIVNNIIDGFNMGEINASSEIVLNLYTALNYNNVLNITAVANRLAYNKNSHNSFESVITENDINDINLTYTDRCLFDYTIHYNANYGMDLLTKEDLLLIWYKGMNNTLKSVNTNVKILKNIGNLIIEIIENKLINTLNIIKTNLDSNNSSWEQEFSIYEQVQADIDKIFTTSGLCQHIDQVNCLSELSHKNRLSYIGEGNLALQTAKATVRNIYQWHFGKVCPIESPEGRNIGLVATLASYASISSNGHIITGYYKVHNGLISRNVIYLDYYNERKYYITLFNNTNKHANGLDKNNGYINNNNNNIATLHLPLCNQVFSCATNLIPFLNYNDPTRALMAANMQRQAIPLITPQAPLISTTEESSIMANTHYNIIAHCNSIVIEVSSVKIIIYEIKYKRYKIYLLAKSNNSNQGTYFKLRTSIDFLQVLSPGDIIAECQSSDNGDISLGANLLVAFTCWNGFNYEDSILISESVVSNGVLDSLHIIELETKICDTQFGREWLTNDLKMVPIEHYWYLPKDGIIENGWVVCENDILVGKLSPYSSVEDLQINENKANKQIKGKLVNESKGKQNKDEYNGSNVRNTSLRVPTGIALASVLEVCKIYSSKPLELDGSYEEYIINLNITIKKYAERWYALTSQVFQINPYVNTSILLKDKAIQYGLEMLYKRYINDLKQLEQHMFEKFGNRLAAEGNVYQHVLESIKIKLLIRKSIQTGDKVCGRHGNKGVISKIIPREDMPFMSDGTPVDIVLNPLGVPSRMNLGQILEANFGLISYKFGIEFKQMLWIYEHGNNKEYAFNMILSKVYEIHPNSIILSFDKVLNLIHNLANGVNISCPLFNTSIDKLMQRFNKRLSLSNFNGQLQLYDGRTGLPFDSESTVGIIYIFKLNHLVDDKIHARNTGPRSLVTQQPLKGKANKGGQRLGEMEIWALQSYGAANTIREALTAKCDDVIARHALHESILNDQLSFKTSWNESLLVLLRELFAMCINVKLK